MVQPSYPAGPVYPAVPSYPAQQYWAPPTAPPQNVLAWVAFGLGLGGLMFGLLASVPAIVLGHIARSRIRRTGEQGGGAALTGLIAGYVITGGIVLFLVAYILFIVGMFAFMIPAAAAGSNV
ncbi:DUF4190 domain-containing protein [Agromyces sp. LHK192]|uniref:DUF4190 domain-containing protein n=1 Tax=Agromyces sp. LHK192 TaxID=2498704 RepID=UPI0013E325C4|nr:DUF4190 domain-containing protein [Agromyces sp. LHK192]